MTRIGKRALVILSGGQDSTTCLYWARTRFDEVRALSFDYGQRHHIELNSARRISELAGVEHDTVDVGSVFAGLSPLTNRAMDVETYDSAETLPGGLEKTFVPGRNILFLTIAANRAYITDCDAMIIGVSQEDYGGYPDCRLEFVKQMEAALALGLDRKLKIHAPLIHLDKRETVLLADKLNGCMEALAYSHTCYNGQFPPCGSCHACLLRERGFHQALIADPLVLRAQDSATATQEPTLHDSTLNSDSEPTLNLMTRTSITRRIQFCCGHRVHGHESKCRNLHGHNYVALFHAEAEAGLDTLGRVIDFSELKTRLGGWLDEHWDHGMVLWKEDTEAIQAASLVKGQKMYLLDANPTAENMARELLGRVAPKLMVNSGVRVTRVVLWETENCYAEVTTHVR